MLEAIEKEDFNSLPGLLFTRNFVKQYAVALGLDPEPILADLPHVDISTTPMPEPPAQSRSKHAEIWDPEWNGAISSFVWFVLAVAAGIAAYVHFNRPLETAPGPKNPAPAAQVAEARPQPKPAPRPDSTPANASADQTRTTPVAATPVVSHEPSVSAGNQPRQTDDESAAGHKVKVSITAHADSWIQVTADGKTVFTGTLKPNESREISGNEMVQLLAGNAGGITVSLNGRTLDPLGAEGQVKMLRLTEEGLQAGVRNPHPMDDRL
jgi:cytoskeletal protein RodZ